MRRLRSKIDDPFTRSCFTRSEAWATCWKIGNYEKRSPARSVVVCLVAGRADFAGQVVSFASSFMWPPASISRRSRTRSFGTNRR